MKKIIILIIVFCLLSFVEFSCFSAQRDNYKKIWDSWKEGEKYIYLWGLSDGLNEHAILGNSLLVNPEHLCGGFSSSSFLSKYLWLPEYSGEVRKVIKEEIYKALGIVIQFCSSKIPVKTIKDVTTDLYRDPANSYIYIADMCYLAFWKIKGKDIEPMLIKLREKASN